VILFALIFPESPLSAMSGFALIAIFGKIRGLRPINGLRRP
jgi:hypothetical protein